MLRLWPRPPRTGRALLTARLDAPRHGAVDGAGFSAVVRGNLPGRIKTATKHPMLAGVKLWAFAHLLANGLLSDVVLFGGFLAWAVVDRISLKRRPPQMLRQAPARPWNDAAAVVLGLAAYVLFVLWAHVRLFGVAPLG